MADIDHPTGAGDVAVRTTSTSKHGRHDVTREKDIGLYPLINKKGESTIKQHMS